MLMAVEVRARQKIELGELHLLFKLPREYHLGPDPRRPAILDRRSD